MTQITSFCSTKRFITRSDLMHTATARWSCLKIWHRRMPLNTCDKGKVKLSQDLTQAYAAQHMRQRQGEVVSRPDTGLCRSTHASTARWSCLKIWHRPMPLNTCDKCKVKLSQDLTQAYAAQHMRQMQGEVVSRPTTGLCRFQCTSHAYLDHMSWLHQDKTYKTFTYWDKWP